MPEWYQFIKFTVCTHLTVTSGHACFSKKIFFSIIYRISISTKINSITQYQVPVYIWAQHDSPANIVPVHDYLNRPLVLETGCKAPCTSVPCTNCPCTGVPCTNVPCITEAPCTDGSLIPLASTLICGHCFCATWYFFCRIHHYNKTTCTYFNSIVQG